MNKDQVKFRHYRSLEAQGPLGTFVGINPRGGATLAYTTDNVKGRPVCVGSFAYCNPSDNYRRSYGRAKSLGRLIQNAQSGYNHTDYDKHFVEDLDDVKAFLSLMDEVMADQGYSPR